MARWGIIRTMRLRAPPRQRACPDSPPGVMAAAVRRWGPLRDHRPPRPHGAAADGCRDRRVPEPKWVPGDHTSACWPHTSARIAAQLSGGR